MPAPGTLQQTAVPVIVQKPAQQVLNAVKISNGNKVVALGNLVSEMNTWFNDFEFIDRSDVGAEDRKYAIEWRVIPSNRGLNKNYVKYPIFEKDNPVYSMGIPAHSQDIQRLRLAVEWMEKYIRVVVVKGQNKDYKAQFLGILRKKVDDFIKQAEIPDVPKQVLKESRKALNPISIDHSDSRNWRYGSWVIIKGSLTTKYMVSEQT